MRRAVCNEMFGNQEFSRTCGLLKTCGFAGVEIAPYTLSNVNGYFSTSTLAQIRSTLEVNDLAFAGFHWLFAHPTGMHITTADPQARRRAMDHLKGLLFAAGELGGGNLILGSPKQRSVSDVTPEEGLRRLADFLREAADAALEANSTICLEALPKKETNVMNTLAEARTLVEQIGHPAIQSMFDFHNCGDETLSWHELVREYKGIIRHVHINRNDGGHPLPGSEGLFRATFKELATQKYLGWVSLEIFTIPADPLRVLLETRDFLDGVVHS